MSIQAGCHSICKVWGIDGINAPSGDLSSREVCVLNCARRGLGNADIGRALSISEHPVESHIKRILKKLHAANRAEAVSRGHELGLLSVNG